MKWKTVRIAEIADVNPRLAAENGVRPETLVSFVPMAAVSEATFSIENPVDRPYNEVAKGYTPFRRGDVIVAKITPCFENGKMALARDLPRDLGFGSTEFHVLRAGKDLDRGYLFHLLRVPHVRHAGAAKMNGAAGQRRVPARFFENLQIPLPPLADQKRIARILDAADALRAKRREALAQLDALVQSVFLGMFGDPVANPLRWDIAPMSDVVDGKWGIKAGPFGSSLKKEEYVPSGYRVYGQEQVIAGRFDVGDYYVDERKFQQLQSCAVKPGDILVSLVGSYGKVLVVPEAVEPGIINPRLLKITPRPQLVTSLYLATVLGSESTQQCLEGMSHGGTMGILNAGLLKQLMVPMPPVELQERFGEIVPRVKEWQQQVESHQAELDRLFASLQARAFRGEL